MRKAFITDIDEAGFITFKQNELTELLTETYDRGYKDGYNSVPPVSNVSDNINIKEMKSEDETQLVIEI